MDGETFLIRLHPHGVLDLICRFRSHVWEPRSTVKADLDIRVCRRCDIAEATVGPAFFD